MTVSLVTLVFSLSLNNLDDERRWKSAIDAVIQANFLAYDEFVQEMVENASQEHLTPIVKKVSSRIEESKYLILLLNRIIQKFAEPLHVGKILTEQNHIRKIRAASLDELELINSLDVARNVQIVVPHVDSLITKIEQYLNMHQGAGIHVDEVNAGLELEPSLQSFLPNGPTFSDISFSFGLNEPGSFSPPPPFETSVVVDIRSIENSSFIYWIKNKARLGDVVLVEDNRVKFAPSLNDAPYGYREVKLGELSLKLSDEIARSDPENRFVSILGTEVPGLMIVIASPLTLFFLAYYFMFHVRHLRSVAERDRESLRQFAWLPLSLTQCWTVRWRNTSLSVQSWKLETVASGIGLPIVALAVLYRQLSTFGGVEFWSTSVLLFGALGIIGFGSLSLRNIARVRVYVD